MTLEQIIIFSILFACLILFVWGKFRYDLVAIFGTLCVVFTGLIPARDAFLGFAHPAVITVATVLIISDTIKKSGIVDLLSEKIEFLAAKPSLHVAGLTTLVTLISGFMNNVGALALLMPVAIKSAKKAKRSPSLVLMPLAFGSILGGLTTLIGTPPNIIIAAYREKASGEAFSMFDFSQVGFFIAIVGALFVATIGWKLIPKRGKSNQDDQELFKIENYFSELVVTEDSKIQNQPYWRVLRIFNSDWASIKYFSHGSRAI